MTKLLMEVKGGVIVRTVSTAPLEFVIVDWDLLDDGTEPCTGIAQPVDEVVENLYEAYDDAIDPPEIEVRDILKDNHL